MSIIVDKTVFYQRFHTHAYIIYVHIQNNTLCLQALRTIHFVFGILIVILQLLNVSNIKYEVIMM